MKLRVVSAEKIENGDGEAARLVIEVSDIGDWDRADAAQKLVRLVKAERVCQEQRGS